VRSSFGAKRILIDERLEMIADGRPVPYLTVGGVVVQWLRSSSDTPSSSSSLDRAEQCRGQHRLNSHRL